MCYFAGKICTNWRTINVGVKFTSLYASTDVLNFWIHSWLLLLLNMIGSIELGCVSAKKFVYSLRIFRLVVSTKISKAKKEHELSLRAFNWYIYIWGELYISKFVFFLALNRLEKPSLVNHRMCNGTTPYQKVSQRTQFSWLIL